MHTITISTIACIYIGEQLHKEWLLKRDAMELSTPSKTADTRTRSASFLHKVCRSGIRVSPQFTHTLTCISGKRGREETKTLYHIVKEEVIDLLT